MVLDKIGASPVLRKAYLDEDAFLWLHYKKGSMERCTIEGKVEGKRRKGRPLTLWASDIVKFVGGSWLMQFIRLLTEKGGALW